MTATYEQDASPALSADGFRLVLAGLMAVMGLAVIDSNIVNTALPRIAADLGDAARMAWAVTAFLLASTISAPLYGKLSDLYGRRRLLVIAIVMFLIGSALCGAAHSMPQLIAYRAMQGLGAGGLVTLVQATIGDLVAPTQRARYQAMFTLVFAACSLAGPLLGGALTTYLSWRWVFLINIPLGAMALALIVSSLPALQTSRRRSIDYLGAALLAISTTATLVLLGSGFSMQRASISAALALVAVVSLVLLLRQERRATEPILDLGLFRNRTFAIGSGATATMSFAMLAALVLIPLYLQLVVGQTPMQAAMIVTPQILGMVTSSFLGARLASKVGHVARLLLAGVLFEAIGLWGLVVAAGFALPAWAFSTTALLLGMGMGLGMPNAVAIVQNAVARDQLGVATGAISFFRSLGGAAGVAVSGGVVTLVLQAGLARQAFHIGARALLEQGARATANLTPAEHGRYIDVYRHAIQAGFGLCAIIITGAFVTVLFLPHESESLSFPPK